MSKEIVKTPTQLQRNLNPTIVGGWTWKWLCIPPTPTETQCPYYLSCYSPNLDQTLKIGSWDHLEPIFAGIFFCVKSFWAKKKIVLKNRVSNSWDITDIEFLWVGGVVDIYSHFCVQPPTIVGGYIVVWVLHENDFAHPPPTTTTTTHRKLNVSIILSVIEPILTKL